MGSIIMDWREKLAAIKAKQAGAVLPISELPVVPTNILNDKPLLTCEACPNTVKTLHKFKTMNLCKTCYDKELNLPPIVPGDMGQPQTVTEQFIEADRRLGNAVVGEAAAKFVNAESLLTEEVLSTTIDRERFMEIFSTKVNQYCIGKNRQEIEDAIVKDHIMLFDIRAGIQAMLAYRTELLKDETAEERAKALKEDWLYKPAKTRATASKPKAEKKEKISPLESMRKMLVDAGLPEAEVEARMKKFQGIS